MRAAHEPLNIGYYLIFLAVVPFALIYSIASNDRKVIE
jgi:hypothetical protein